MICLEITPDALYQRPVSKALHGLFQKIKQIQHFSRSERISSRFTSAAKFTSTTIPLRKKCHCPSSSKTRWIIAVISENLVASFIKRKEKSANLHPVNQAMKLVSILWRSIFYYSIARNSNWFWCSFLKEVEILFPVTKASWKWDEKKSAPKFKSTIVKSR